MEIKEAAFLGSWEKQDDMPQKNHPEFAFIGRSNVGKSSLINMLCNKKGLAKTSATPGKTQTLNLFQINKDVLFCDLPGYGYAKVSKTMRVKFSRMIQHYLTKRPNLVNLFILIDLRIPPQEMDIEFINSCGAQNIPFALVGTKADKLSKADLEKNKKSIEDRLYQDWEELPPLFITSSEKKWGKEEIQQYMDFCIDQVNPELGEF